MTTRINLLPWREMRRRQQDRQLLTIAVAAWIVMGVAVVNAYLYVGALIEVQGQRNKLLETEIAKVEQEIKEIADLKKQRQDLISRMNVIYQLQGDRTGMVRMFDELVRKLPEGVFLTSVKTTGGGVALQGVAQSNARVSALMRNLDGSDWFNTPELEVINVREKGGERLSEFSLNVKRGSKKQQKAAETPS
jgi:type IV pilus assembly protein PilN